MALDTAEEFAKKLSEIDLRDGTFQHENPDSIAAIDARDNAVRVALIDEIFAAGEGQLSAKHWGELIDEALHALREKYAAKEPG